MSLNRAALLTPCFRENMQRHCRDVASRVNKCSAWNRGRTFAARTPRYQDRRLQVDHDIHDKSNGEDQGDLYGILGCICIDCAGDGLRVSLLDPGASGDGAGRFGSGCSCRGGYSFAASGINRFPVVIRRCSQSLVAPPTPATEPPRFLERVKHRRLLQDAGREDFF